MDHMTIKFAPTDQEVLDIPLGKSVYIDCVGWAADEKCQTLVVRPQLCNENEGWYMPGSGQSYPHVTVATQIGMKPVYSNELLARGYNEIPKENQLVLIARIGAFVISETRHPKVYYQH